MKKIFVLLAVVFSFSAVLAFGGGDKVINKNQLPAQAQSFINDNFAGVKISYAKHETDFLERSYEVVLADGTKLEFTNKGAWKEVDCRYGEVPSAIVPAPIKKYIAENYSAEKVLKIERDSRGYEVKLSNRLELKFNNDFRIVDIDD
ncbi:MAG: PepSY-like domain-containing protein [Bacteroidaceae bacterium]|nr:PepSY-like domain-containing protein [Bacteroidaceae bacterium]MBR3906479.1 PepSY-like domain-containing protein [Bacteroidaceae bacterium]